jgi:spore coat polysaccharide biosynthesis protein SpsF
MKIKIRRASVKDAIFFYELRNEKAARKNFFNTKNIKYNDHLKWYKKKLKKKEVIFLVASINNSQKIATVRYETEKIFTNISINISKKFRNLGYGSKIIKNSEKFLKQKLIINSPQVQEYLVGDKNWFDDVEGFFWNSYSVKGKPCRIYYIFTDQSYLGVEFDNIGIEYKITRK